MWSLFLSGSLGFFVRALVAEGKSCTLRALTIDKRLAILCRLTPPHQNTKSSARFTFRSPLGPLADWVRLGLLSGGEGQELPAAE